MSKKLILTPNAFKAGKVYAVKPINGDGDFDFVRNTGRTRVNVNGNIEELSNNIVALDYQNGCPEILLEPQTTNLIPDNVNFTGWNLRGSNIEISNQSSPFVGYNAIKYNRTSASWISYLQYKGNAAVNNVKCPHSIFLKYIDVQYLIFLPYGTPTFTIDLINKNIAYTNNLISNIKVIELSNNWIKVEWIQEERIDRDFYMSLNGSPNSFTNTNTNNIGSCYMAFPQSTEGENSVTSTIITNGSQVTRNKDILSNDLTPIIQPTYTAFLEVVGDEGRLKIEDNLTGIDLPLNGSGKIAIQVDSQIKIIFPDNGQPQTELIYDKPDDLRNIDIVSKLAATRIGVIAIEDGIQDVSNWISGSVSSYFIETDWSAETDLFEEFREQDWDYFPAIDLSNAIDLRFAFRDNNLTSFPFINFNNNVNVAFAWTNNNLISFPANMFNTNTNDKYDKAFRLNNLNQQSVDNILISVNTSAQANNITDGELGIDLGTNATPSQAGKDAADALFANGWTVNLNGYTPS